MRRLHLLGTAVLLAAVVVGACGGESPSSPSATGGVVVQGVVLGDSAALSASSATPTNAAQNQKITVQVEGTSITADVGANGTFQLEGIPGGTFTLIFLVDGVEIGRVVVTAEEGSEVKVVVQVKDSTLVLVQIEVDGPGGGPSPSPSASPTACIVNGGQVGRGIELEGNVATGDSQAFDMSAAGATGLVSVSAASASFSCIGNAKAPTDAECKASVKAGAKVHVRGTLMACTTTDAQVTASEVKVQKD
jgi:glucose/arabinose dehydrogenase